ncbi:MAG: 16S rRNA (uracil(1498)-N(3))-methyltransferase, partial [Bifidobacteriaceae bacterium]|nr:16S rRNA (uracil(1498)-N(3))-methyltransferase [Bifidobacteriaceae bacterium]
MTAPLIWVGAAALAAARPGTGLSIGGEEARHAVAVKRLRPGEDVLLSDAAGRLARAAVTRVVPGQAPELGVLVRDVEDVPAPVPALALVQALTKQRRDEAAVAAATGLGVDAIIPWQSDRSVVRWLDGGREDRPDRPGKAGRGRERWQQLALAEAKVARRPRVPSVAPVVDSKGLFRRLR